MCLVFYRDAPAPGAPVVPTPLVISLKLITSVTELGAACGIVLTFCLFHRASVLGKNEA